MQLSRKIIGEFVAVFLMGTVVGGLAIWDYAETELTRLRAQASDDAELSKFMTKTNDSDTVIVARLNKKYADEYHLSQDELDKIQPTLKEMAQKMSHIRRQFGVDFISTYTEYHDKIASELTPEHREAYEKASSDRKKQLSSLLKLNQNASDQGAK